MRTTKLTTDPRPVSVAIPIQELNIKKCDLNKISRYLDVTRSAMIFGGRVMLVEGIAEALLIPTMAKRLFKNLTKPGPDRDCWKRFQGATMVAIDGVDFEPYVDLLLKPVGASRIADLVVVVTDKDPDVLGDRPRKLRDKAIVHGATKFLSVHENAVTLEESLYLPDNEILLKAAYLDVRPGSKAKWEEEIENKPEADRPAAFLALFTAKSYPVRKGDYAQALASRLDHDEENDVPSFLVRAPGDDGEEAAKALALAVYTAARSAFKVPDYLELAIRALVQ